MSINPYCFKCKKELDTFGGILLSPPDINDVVKKYHICSYCFEEIINDMNKFEPAPANYKNIQQIYNDEDVFKTFKEWSELGFKVLKGSKALKRDKKGICLFSKNQVCKINTYSIDYDDNEIDIDLPGNPMDYGN